MLLRRRRHNQDIIKINKQEFLDIGQYNIRITLTIRQPASVTVSRGGDGMTGRFPINNIIIKDLLHGTHETRRAVSKTHTEDPPLKMAKRGRKSRLLTVFLGDSELVETTSEIERGEDLSTTCRIKKVINPRKLIPGLNRDSV